MPNVQDVRTDSARSAVTAAHMIETPVSQRDDRLGHIRPAGHVVARKAEIDRLRTFRATSETHGGDTRIVRAAGIQYEAGASPRHADREDW